MWISKIIKLFKISIGSIFLYFKSLIILIDLIVLCNFDRSFSMYAKSIFSFNIIVLFIRYILFIMIR